MITLTKGRFLLGKNQVFYVNFIFLTNVEDIESIIESIYFELFIRNSNLIKD